jgi:2-succinyl-5-enolpyruvyl-6-hydroxy-3-cyclohexene-1-carboxylate synthase
MTFQQEALTDYLNSFINELIDSGVSHVVISPGSRSTPMALLMVEHPDIDCTIHIDERSAAFFALGIAKTTLNAVALLCTSGTAAANYYPAIIEATLSRVPLVVITADRPHELRDVGAPQTIDQINLYGNHVKWFVEMALPENTPSMLQYVKKAATRAVMTAEKAPAGPVHLNFPFRDPLVPKMDLENKDHFTSEKKLLSFYQGKKTLDLSAFDSIASLLSRQLKGIIVCGYMDDENFKKEVIAFSKKTGFPILADPLSGLRTAPYYTDDDVITTYDSFLRSEEIVNKLDVELIVRFGPMPVSKALTLYIKSLKTATQLVIDGGGGWRDPLSMHASMIYCDENEFCRQILERIESKPDLNWKKRWISLEKQTKALISTISDVEELDEGKLFYKLSEWLPEHSTMFVGNSMPIRDLDTFFLKSEKRIRLIANRGANGIDGVVSTALGGALVSTPFFLVIGDLSFFHDLNGLLAAKLRKLDVTIVLLNNNGGGIFSYLPQANEPKHFETLFGTPIDLDYSHAAKLYGAEFIRAKNWEEVQVIIEEASSSKGLRILEVPTDREKNVEVHRSLWNRVSQEIKVR